MGASAHRESPSNPHLLRDLTPRVRNMEPRHGRPERKGRLMTDVWNRIRGALAGAGDPGADTPDQSLGVAGMLGRVGPALLASSRAVNEVEVTVEDMAFTGVASNYRVLGPGGQLLKLTQPNMRRGEAAMEWEETGYASFDPADVVLLRD